MKTLKHKWNLCKAVALVTYKEWGAYRTHSMVSLLVGPVSFVVQYFIWTAVYSGQQTLQGMELRQVLTYYGCTTLIHYLTMDFADWNLAMLVRTGKFLTFQLRPLHHRFFAFSQKLGHRVLGLVIEFVPCFLIFHFIFGINMIPRYIGWTLISIGLSFLMNFYVNYTIGLTAFWLVNADGLRGVWQALTMVLSGGLIPLVFFPVWLQKALLFLPFQYITYVPSMVFSGSYTLAGLSLDIPVIVALQGAAVAVTALISQAVYTRAMRRFTAAGG